MLRHAGNFTQDKKKININNCYYPSLNHKIDTLQASLVLKISKYSKTNGDIMKKLQGFMIAN